MTAARAALLAIAVCAAACGGGSVEPVDIDTRNDRCSWCRMAVSDLRFAAQVVAPLEEPRIFDDIGCLRDWLARGGTARRGAIAYVTDHRTKAWVPAADAVYARVSGMSTPMASGIVAYAEPSSRAADPEAAGGEALTARDVFGADLPPGGAP